MCCYVMFQTVDLEGKGKYSNVFELYYLYIFIHRREFGLSREFERIEPFKHVFASIRSSNGYCLVHFSNV